ncbi:hypothetical protein D3C86_1111760 [compost metagenome]
MDNKIKFIQDYFNEKKYFDEIWTNVWISFVVLFVTYLLLAISRGLTDLYYKRVEPWIIGIMDSKAIYTMEDKKTLESKNYLLEKKLKTKEEDLLRHLGDNQNLKSNIELQTKKWNAKIDNAEKEIKTVRTNVDELKEKLTNLKQLDKWLWDTALLVLKESDISIILKPTYPYNNIYLNDNVQKSISYLSEKGLVSIENINSQKKVLRTKLGDIFMTYYNMNSLEIINAYNSLNENINLN